MSKEEFLKIQTCVLKVNIHCDGCKQKVKKILQKIDGVYTINIDSEQGKVTVSGDVNPDILIKKLTKNGKHAELWGANNNLQSQLNDQLKALQIEQAKCGNNKGQNQKGGNNQPKGGPPVGQLQQLQQMKDFQDLKMPPQFMKDLKLPINKEPNQKSVRFNLPEDEDLSDDDDDDDDGYDVDELDDDGMEDAPLNKMKPMIGNGQGGPQIPKMLMSNTMGGNIGGNGGGIAKGGGGVSVGNIPVQMNVGSGGGGGGNGGNKGNNGNNHVNNQNQGGGKGGKNGGGQPQGSKNGGGVVGGGGQSMISGAGSGSSGGGVANGNNFVANVAKKGGGMPNMMGMNPGDSMGLMGSLPVRPTGQISNLAAVQGLPTSAMNTSGSGGGVGAGYFQGAPLPEHLARNPYYQQQLAAMMMNQQLANGNERFQPMMYARPPPAVNYMPPPYPPYPYPYAPPPAPGDRTDNYAMFSDENTSSCSVM